MTRTSKTRWTLPAALLLLWALPQCQRAEAPVPAETEALPPVEEAPRQESPPAKDTAPENDSSPSGPVSAAPPPVRPSDPVPETDPRAGLCSSGGWCWLHPETPTDAYRDVWALDDDNALAVGSPGRVLHWRRGGWKFLPSDTGNLLHAVWGSSPTDAWAVGEGGTIVHWDGIRWTRAREGGPTLYTVFGTGPQQVWAGGEGGTLLHWDGTRWFNVPNGSSRTIRHLWASGPRDLWASVWNFDDLGGDLRRWDGQTWSDSLGGVDLYITSIWGFGPEDVWITGSDGVLAHWAGVKWQRAPESDPGQYDKFMTVRGRDPSDLWVTGTGLWHFNGQRLSTSLYNPLAVGLFTSIAVGSKRPLLAVGHQGTLVQYTENGTWEVLTTHRPRMLKDFLDVWAPDAKTPWVVDDHRVARWTGTSWKRVDEGMPVELGVFVLSGTSPTDVWAGGRMAGSDQLAMAHFDGTSWRHMILPEKETPTSLWALHPDEVWATGYGSVLHWNGRSWRTVLKPGGYTYGVHGSREDNVWVVGSGGALFQWNGREWVDHTLRSTSPGFTAVWVSGPEDVWATDDHGDIWHWDGHEVRLRWEAGVLAPLRSLYGRAADDVWAAGEQGTLVHWDGRAWTREPSGTTHWIKNLWGAKGNVFAVGAMQTVLERREAPGTQAP